VVLSPVEVAWSSVVVGAVVVPVVVGSVVVVVTGAVEVLVSSVSGVAVVVLASSPQARTSRRPHASRR